MRRYLFVALFFISCYKQNQNDIGVSLALLNQNSTIKISILGDSLSQWSDAFGLKGKLSSRYQITDLSVAGYDTRNWLNDLPRAEQLPTDVWIIELGTNDASYTGTSGFLERYKEILTQLTINKSPYFILSAVPRTKQTGLFESILTNNQRIRELVAENPRYRLADLDLVFQKSGNSENLYPLADPIHPNQLGYDLIGNEYARILLGL
ncbi:GDSL-like protein [Leptospira ryugenii]|uniref:GDSL-like protein n=1 Tax=Leptospira ryugenii TaxID=1917863 RepID=A0A2P2E3N5_9LEPT|nr:SGNH/GDSL hydrolase family protein [Leptospira ryugenii]GBF51508.1 GDSL-like protein [Leptospira ryugenii]